MRTIPLSAVILLSLSGAFAAPGAVAQVLEGDEARFSQSEGFLGDHPDLQFRKRGLQAYFSGRHGEAAEAFRTAARYADKPSMAMLAEMHWDGTGVPQDRPLAYAWADLAAERGYPELVAKREAYWARLDPEQRARAIAVGRPMLGEYGDDVAQPRMVRRLSNARRKITGSRVGHVGNLTIRFPGQGFNAAAGFDGARYYADKFYEPSAYYAWQAATWNQRREGQGEVDLGEPRPSDAPRDDGR